MCSISLLSLSEEWRSVYIWTGQVASTSPSASPRLRRVEVYKKKNSIHSTATAAAGVQQQRQHPVREETHPYLVQSLSTVT